MRNYLTTRVLATLPNCQVLACAASGLAWTLLSLTFQAPVVETLRYWASHWNAHWKRTPR
jgi:hypothetical protein